MEMKVNMFDVFKSIKEQLDAANIYYDTRAYRDDAFSFLVHVLGEYWGMSRSSVRKAWPTTPGPRSSNWSKTTNPEPLPLQTKEKAMSLKIRLSRGGAKKRPFYRIVVADARMPRDGRFVERLGTFDPLKAKDAADRIVIDAEKAKAWIAKGAQPTDRVARLLETVGVGQRAAQSNPEKAKPKKKAQERAAAAAAAEAAAAAAAATASAE